MTSSNISQATEEPGLGPGRTLFSVFQPNSNRLHADVLIDGVSSVLLGAYFGAQDDIQYIIHAAPGPETPSSESIIPDSRHDLDEQIIAMDTDLERRSTLATTIRGEDNHLTLQADEPEGAGEISDHGSNGTSPLRSHRGWVWLVTLIVGLLVLIMTPGLIVGTLTRQVAWGIAISGAFAPAVMFFGGPYYHHNK